MAAAENGDVAGGEAFADEDVIGLSTAADSDGVKLAQGSRRERREALRAGNGTVVAVARKNGWPPDDSADLGRKRRHSHCVAKRAAGDVSDCSIREECAGRGERDAGLAGAGFHLVGVVGSHAVVGLEDLAFAAER